ncbi:unnamed protein product [Closterium sp. NIES-53]
MVDAGDTMPSQTGREGRRSAANTFCARKKFSHGGGCGRATSTDFSASPIPHPPFRLVSPDLTRSNAPLLPPSYCRRSPRPRSSYAVCLSFLCLTIPLLALLAHPLCAQSARSLEATLTTLPALSEQSAQSAVSAHSNEATQSALPSRSASAFPPQLRNVLGAFRRCQPSSLPGYTTSKSFYGGLTLHWAATTGSTLRLALQAKAGSVSAKSWFAIGWTPDGQMGGSDAVVRAESGAAAAEAIEFASQNQQLRSP